MAGCKTCCDDVPQQVLIERVLKSIIRQMIQNGELQAGLSTCDGLALPKGTKVPDCDSVGKTIRETIREWITQPGNSGLRGELISVINELILDGTLQAGLRSCDGGQLGKGARVASCSDNNSGGNQGGNQVDKFLTNVIIDEQAKTMTFKVANSNDIVVNVSKFLDGLNDFVTNAVIDNAAKTVTLKVKNQPDVVIDLTELLANVNDTYHTVKQPTFNNDTRVLTIPQERFVNGVSQGTDNLEITIPAMGNAPGADNDTTVTKLELVESAVADGKEYKVKLTDSAGAVLETPTAIRVTDSGSKATISTESAVNNTGEDLPLKLYGNGRTALMGEPHAWEEVTGSDGQTYLRPLYRKA